MANLIKFVQMEYKQLNIDDISFFKEIIGSDFVFTDVEQLLSYSHDETENLSFPPEVVLKPRTVEQVAGILQFARNFADDNSIMCSRCSGYAFIARSA